MHGTMSPYTPYHIRKAVEQEDKPQFKHESLIQVDQMTKLLNRGLIECWVALATSSIELRYVMSVSRVCSVLALSNILFTPASELTLRGIPSATSHCLVVSQRLSYAPLRYPIWQQLPHFCVQYDHILSWQVTVIVRHACVLIIKGTINRSL